MTLASLTIAIPTLGRPDYILAQARALAEAGFDGVFAVAMSDPAEVLAETTRRIEALTPPFRWVPIHAPGQTVSDALRTLVARFDTPWAVVTMDDDFPLVPAIRQAVTLLDSDSGYAAVGGKMVMMTVKPGVLPQQILRSGLSWINPLEHASPAARLSALFENYSVLHFSVSRSSVWREWAAQAPIARDSLGLEILANGMIALAGKVAVLEDLMFVRCNHDRRQGESVKPVIDQVLVEDWSSSAATVVERLAGALAIATPVSIEDARHHVKRGFSEYLGKSLLRQSVTRSFWRSLLHRVQCRLKARGITLNALRSPTSRHHAAFAPVDRAVTVNNSRQV